jgi:hypothetical protein
VPFDYAIPFHMLVAMVGGGLAIGHALCHMSDYAHAVRSEAHAASTSHMRCRRDESGEPFHYLQLMAL